MATPLPQSLQTFGEQCFSRTVMQNYFDKETYAEIANALDNKKQLSQPTMEKFAQAALKWAVEHDCTHFTHVFQPLSGVLGEKHDIIWDINRDGAIETSFNASRLLTSEPDGSSFPNAGARPTHSARGNTVWDPRSYLTVSKLGRNSTLRIPSIFVAWTGVALDNKTPLLRSELALERATLKVLHSIGATEHTRIDSHCGLEQEFFMIDEKFYNKRPDLATSGRTLLGADPPKGQDQSDRYFGWQSTRAQDAIYEMEQEFWKFGIPNSTRHREVAPGQYEMAPMFQIADQANDNNMLMMQVMTEVARRHGIVCLFHEKPFANLNGSGKHNNWSFGSNVEGTFFSPKSKYFLLATAAFVRGVHLHGDLLRSTVATSGNDHRLGGHEAPPGIMSIFLGSSTRDMVDRAIRGEDASYKPQDKEFQDFGVPYLPNFARQPSDRNRTSPIAFCGNRFEFRAVGSSVNTAWSTTVLNTITAESMEYIAQEIAKAKEEGDQNPLQSVVSRTLKEHSAVLFEGNGYSHEWVIEAEKRGLPNSPHTAGALKALTLERVKQLFVDTQVLTPEELQTRHDVFYENFCLDLNVEVQTLLDMSYTLVLPAVYRQLKLMKESGAPVSAQEEIIKKLVGEYHEGLDRLKDLQQRAADMEGDVARADFFQSEVRPAMNQIRTVADTLERNVDKKLWPLPNYHDMLNDL